MKRIFVVGPNKCGTSSLHNFFEVNGVRSIHWDKGNLARQIVSNVSAGLDPLGGYEEYQAFSDFLTITKEIYISPVLVSDILLRYYPDDIYILNTRNFDKWRNSRDNHRRASDRPDIKSRIETLFRDGYDSKKEFLAYKIIQENPPEKFHVFDLEDTNNFDSLSDFLQEHGFHITRRTPLHINQTDANMKRAKSKKLSTRIMTYVRKLQIR